MTKIQYLVKEDKDSLYTKVSVPNRDFAETGKSRTVTRKKPTSLSLLKTLLTIAAASLLGAAIILWCCHFYQVRFHTFSVFFLARVILLISICNVHSSSCFMGLLADCQMLMELWPLQGT